MQLGRLAAKQSGYGREHDQDHHHREILDDEPSDGDLAALGLEKAPLLETAEHDDRARHGKRQAEHDVHV